MMLSRVAEQLYWLGRYVERAESTARLVSVNATLLLDLPRGIAPGWAPLIAITGGAADFEARYPDYEERSVLRFLIADRESPSSILSSLGGARANARTIRETLPRESWELVNSLYIYARDNVSAGLSKRDRHAYLQRVVREGQTLAGLLLGTMSHDAGYTFLTIGRILERADMTTRIIDVRSSSLLPEEQTGLRPYENLQWMSVLKTLSGYQMYRRKMQVRVRRVDALRFLFLDEEFPRACARCVRLVEESLQTLPNRDGPVRVLARLSRALSRTDVRGLASSNDALHEFIDELQLRLAEVHDEISRTWFLGGVQEPVASAAA